MLTVRTIHCLFRLGCDASQLKQGQGLLCRFAGKFLAVDLHQGGQQGDYQRTKKQSQEPIDLQTAQQGDEQDKGRDIGLSADQERSQKIIQQN